MENHDENKIERLAQASRELRELAESVGDHLILSGWYACSKPHFGEYRVYADDFKGRGRQHICDVPASKNYFGKLHEFIAAANPQAIIELLDRLEELEAQ